MAELTQAQRTTTPSQSKIPDRIGQPDSTLPAKGVTTPRAMLDPHLQATVELDAGISQPIGIVFLVADNLRKRE